jgi:hypothetical protein
LTKSGIGKSATRVGFRLGHSAFAAGVTVTIVETSKVGVKVGMVGRGVMDAVGVAVGGEVAVLVGSGDGVTVASSVIGTGADCPQAERNKIPLSSPIIICFILSSSIFSAELGYN